MFISAAVLKQISNLKIGHKPIAKGCHGRVCLGKERPLTWVVPVPVLESPSTSSEGSPASHHWRWIPIKPLRMEIFA